MCGGMLASKERGVCRLSVHLCYICVLALCASSAICGVLCWPELLQKTHLLLARCSDRFPR